MGLTYATFMTSLWVWLLPLWPVSIPHSLWVWLMLPLWPLSMGLTYATFMTSVYPHSLYWLMLPCLYATFMTIVYGFDVWFMTSVYHPIVYRFDLCYDQCLWVWQVCYLYDHCLWVWRITPLSMGLTYATFMTSTSITPLSMGLTYTTFMTIVYGFDVCYLYDQCLSPHSLCVWLMLPHIMTSVYHPIVYRIDLCYLYDQCLSPHSLWVWLMLPLWPVSITP